MAKLLIINVNFEKPEVSYITKLTKLLESIDAENDEVVEKSLRDLISNSLDSFDIASEEYTKETKDLNNFLIRNIESMREEIIDFVQKNTGPKVSNSSVKKMTKTIQNLSEWIADSSSRNEDIKITDDKLERTLEANYTHYFELNNKLFPQHILVNVVATSSLKINIQYTKVTTDEASSMPFSIPEKYEKK